MKTFHGVNLSWTTDEGVIEVRLHRGPCNEISTTTLRELEQLAAWIRAGAGGAQALLFYSDRPKGFSAGADLRELYDGIVAMQDMGLAQVGRLLVGSGDDRPGLLATLREVAASTAREGSRRVLIPLVIQRVRRFLERIHAVFTTLDEAPLTTISAVHGVVFGGGFELALTSDLILADRTARFAFPELRLGIIPGFGGLPRLERDLGNAVARDLLLTGRSLNARRAHELGLVSQVVAPGEVLQAARAAARQATRFDASAIRRAKAFVKPIPRERLAAEIDTFCAMLREPAVEAALRRFVTSTDVRPYLP
jgi:enoyl-CoA hydratase/carnithine racemase